MKIRTIVNLTEAQKARIVSRNEQFPQRICTFEMSPEKAEIISRLNGNYKVTTAGIGNMMVSDEVMISATDDQYSYQRLHVEETKDANSHVAQETIMLQDVLAEAYTSGTIKDGSNIDFALDIMAEAQKRREAILEINQAIQDEKIRKEEEEKPAREAQKKREAEQQAVREKVEIEKKAIADAEEKARNEAIEAEKKAWIEEHGSERLQKGHAGGYRCQKLYEIERAQSVLGSEYIRDDSDVDEKYRSCPSLEALQEVERLKGVIKKGAAIVWLPYGIDGEEETGCEAVKADPGTYSKKYFFRTF